VQYYLASITTSQLCFADNSAGIWGALFSDNLEGSCYKP
jgi:hypothetical protein